MSEHDNDHEEFDNPVDDEAASLKGKGWDILAGGPDDPYGIRSEASASASPVGENPFADDEEVDAILESIGVLGKTPPEDIPEDAFYDRGRGPEGPEPSPLEGQSPEAPPRDLSPEDLGRMQPPVPAPAVSSMPTNAITPEDTQVSQPTVSSMPTDALIPESSPPGEAATSETTIPDTVSMDTERIVEIPPEALAAPRMPSGSPGDVDMDSLLTEPAAMEPLPDPGLARPAEERPPVAPTPVPRVTRPPSAQAFKVDDPFFTVPKPVRSREPDQAPDPDIEKLLITPERINALWDEIEETFDIVVADVRGHFDQTEQAIADLKEARELLLAGPENYDNAEELVVQVRARLRLDAKVRQWAATRGTWIGAYLVIWLIILALSGWFMARFLLVFTETTLPVWLVDSWLPALGGGLGGVVGALWVLIKHIAKKRDFDPIHTPWYITNPFMGMALGFITYLIMRVSLSGLGGVIGITGMEDSPATSITLYLLSVVVGFQQNVLWTLIDRFINAIVPDRGKDEKATSESQPRVTEPSPPASSDRAG